MSRTTTRRRVRIAVFSAPAFLLAFVLVSAEGRSEPLRDFRALATRAASAPDAETLTGVASELEAVLPEASADSTAEALDGAASVYGAVVGRARELELPAVAFVGLVDLSGRLSNRVRARRERLEAEAGDDEDRLESLYRSDAWRMLTGSSVEISFWRGWAQLTRVQQQGRDGAERDEALADADRAFARAARALAFPDRAVRSLLGLGIVRRERGDFEAARRSFERLQQQRAIQSDPALARRVRYELALTAFEALEITRGRRLVGELTVAGELTSVQRRILALREVRALLLISQQQGDLGDPAADEASARLRALLSRAGADADGAMRLIAEFADPLVGRDLGPVGALLEADRAFREQDFAGALSSYAVALREPPELPPGVDVSQARLRVAWANAETGRSEEAMQGLEALLGQQGEAALSDAQRIDAARLLHSLAESSLQSDEEGGAEGGEESRDGDAKLARANRAARLLLEVAPESGGADLARYRRARDLAGRRLADAALAELAAIPSTSSVYPAALVERIRLEAQSLDAAGPGTARQNAAKKLGDSLAEVHALRERGDLPRDVSQEATMAVLRARAAMFAGADLETVLGLVAAAREQQGIGFAATQELLSTEIAALIAAQKISQVVALLASRDDARLSAELRVWQERLADLDRSAAATRALPDVYSRLLEVAPEASQGELRLGRIAALRRAGRAREAVALARELSGDEPESGDAWIELGRSLDAVGDHRAAPEAWRHVAAGSSPGSASWWEARLSLYESALAGDEPGKACGWLDALNGMSPPPGQAARFDAALARCNSSEP